MSESDFVPEDELAEEIFNCPENQLGLYPPPPFVPFIGGGNQSISDDEEESDPEVICASEDSAVTLCSFKSVKTVIASKTNYNGGRFSRFLEDQFGCLIIPLSAVAKLRLPTGNHKRNPPVIVFIPPRGPDHELYDNFSTAAEKFYDMAHLEPNDEEEQTVLEN